ncbi:C-C motif chemokine 21-like [Myripristis murdjan]|uniref:C-C motif chemokine 21-like n=1 Tax=Myripristis murdjan TaxID=586833 RepID=A0A667XZ06_9TELE|nr:C-C motif chemokine 21-like [Myripristis murdjan]
MAARVALLLLLAVICIGFAAAEIPADCCLSVTDKRIPRNLVESFEVQEAGQGCDISATLFITKKVGKRLCAPHPSLSKWVRDLINRLTPKQ